MKKIIVLACMLALVAILVVPMAASAATTTPVSGTIKSATVTVTAPSTIAFGTFAMGWNLQNSTTAGTVTVTPGTSGKTNWTVTAAWAKMKKGTVELKSWLLGSPDGGATTWHAGDGVDQWVYGGDGTGDDVACYGPLTYSGTTATGTLSFYAWQYIGADDVDSFSDAGAYATTVTFTATCDP